MCFDDCETVPDTDVLAAGVGQGLYGSLTIFSSQLLVDANHMKTLASNCVGKGWRIRIGRSLAVAESLEEKTLRFEGLETKDDGHVGAIWLAGKGIVEGVYEEALQVKLSDGTAQPFGVMPFHIKLTNEMQLEEMIEHLTGLIERGQLGSLYLWNLRASTENSVDALKALLKVAKADGMDIQIGTWDRENRDKLLVLVDPQVADPFPKKETLLQKYARGIPNGRSPERFEWKKIKGVNEQLSVSIYAEYSFESSLFGFVGSLSCVAVYVLVSLCLFGFKICLRTLSISYALRPFSFLFH